MTDSYYSNYVFLAVFLAVAILFPLVPIGLAKVLAPRKPSKQKQDIYECGLESKGDAWVQFKVQYYIYALIFVIFDVETIFLYPWAVIYDQLALFGLIEVVVFVGLLVVGYYYAWHKGALEWT
jgi:NADH-quinone oxidoreductase subunit A